MRKLLIVDDEVDVREFAANFFRRRNFEVITAADGLQAIELFERESPHLILLDIKMEEMDGIEVLTRIREKSKEVSVIMVTGKNPEEDEARRRCQDLLVRNYIHKPLQLDELERIVVSVLRET